MCFDWSCSNSKQRLNHSNQNAPVLFVDSNSNCSERVYFVLLKKLIYSDKHQMCMNIRTTISFEIKSTFRHVVLENSSGDYFCTAKKFVGCVLPPCI